MKHKHLRKIKKGERGEFSKIQEEYKELKDALEQNNIDMIKEELVDLAKAIDDYCYEHFNKSVVMLSVD